MAFTDTVRFGFEFQPLQISRCLRVEQAGGPAGCQEYDGIGGGYYPDYSIFPLVITPEITATDPDEVLAPDNVDLPINKDLANMRWTVREEGEADKVITNSDSDYSVVTEGNELGQLHVMRNIGVNKPLTFVFHAQYMDPRSGEVRDIDMTYLAMCKATVQQSVLRNDISAYYLYNPVEETDRVVHATIFSGDKQVPAAKCHCKWQLLDKGAWVDFGEGNTRHDMRFADIANNTMSIRISMDCMGWDETFRCVAFVGADAADLQAKIALGESFQQYTFRIKRQIPQFKARIGRAPIAIPKSQGSVYPQVEYNFRNYSGASDPQRLQRLNTVTKAEWLTAEGTSGTTPTFSKVAEGFAPEIKADKVSRSYGQLLRLVVEDRGPFKMLTTGDGKVLTDGSGKVLLGL